jgi:hypothetical protein
MSVWHEDRKTVGIWMQAGEREAERILTNLEWESVEEALAWFQVEEKVKDGQWVEVEARKEEGELVAYEGKVVKGRMSVRECGVVEQLRTQAVHARLRRGVAEGRITGLHKKNI